MSPHIGPEVAIYTDGGCFPNPGRGGWAVMIHFPNHVEELSGSENNTTNNRMELTAAIKGLERLPVEQSARIYTDSEYVKKGITEWLPGWRVRGWKRKGGALANQDLWLRLDTLTRSHTVDWYWVRGHSGNVHNDRVDELVRKAIASGR